MAAIEVDPSKLDSMGSVFQAQVSRLASAMSAWSDQASQLTRCLSEGDARRAGTALFQSTESSLNDLKKSLGSFAKAFGQAGSNAAQANQKSTG